jgi:predicted dithiol-disulfide oxidoreductase (DUF899 family)
MTRRSTPLRAERRELPWMRTEKPYVLTRPRGGLQVP